ncbi:UDP-glucose 4-epimerase GalE [Streptomyces caniscabiei]|uniref:UDP-glucose 4-epimerase GalE n=1 Tax=Streptomyces caniscabiei TaxID=2746961 RepID=UPI0029A7619B|nr:UDP-glucose 4-epimerase GalE [Streptomyces caniscabiei]MDX2776421.1 UDP-glucose 4-epimerase GalE [Streptomyces caniscabiei]
MNILVTGGAGYIGSHTLIELIASGHTPIVVDNLSNSSQEALRRVEKITSQTIPFHKFDLRDKEKLDQLFTDNSFDAVVHFAGLKAVGESVAKPLEYYGNNIDSTLVLLDVMKNHGVKKIIFSSSATVYGTPEELPLHETSRIGVGITNPYGQTKFMLEQILRDACVADDQMEVSILRYFNPVGAHESGMIGEDPSGIPNNLMPYIAQVAVGKLDMLRVFGDDYDTIDGTAVRDYIHVVDLARGHVAALDHIKPGAHIYNLATGRGTSVLQMVAAFEKASDRVIPYEITARRPGDVPANYASPEKANQELGWKTEKTVEDACADSWRWQSQNPNGYS